MNKNAHVGDCHQTPSSSDHESGGCHQSAMRELKEREAPHWRPQDPLPPGKPLALDVRTLYPARVL